MIELTDTDPMLREVNTGLMVRWINNDLMVRAGYDVRHSIVLYDGDKMFTSALPASVDMTDDGVLDALDAAGLRFWSKGIV